MPSIDRITIADEPERWAALGFDVRDDACELGSVELELAGEAAGGGIVGWSLCELLGEQLDGLPTERSQAPERAPAAAHANGALAIDHVVAISPDLDRSVAALQAAGLDLRRIREQPTAAGAPRQAFFRLGSEILEVVQEPDEVIERAGGAGRPATFWGLALLVEDIDETVARLAPHAGTVRDAQQPGRRIATLSRSAGLAIPVALITREQERVG